MLCCSDEVLQRTRILPVTFSGAVSRTALAAATSLMPERSESLLPEEAIVLLLALSF